MLQSILVHEAELQQYTFPDALYKYMDPYTYQSLYRNGNKKDLAIMAKKAVERDFNTYPKRSNKQNPDAKNNTSKYKGKGKTKDSFTKKMEAAIAKTSGSDPAQTAEEEGVDETEYQVEYISDERVARYIGVRGKLLKPEDHQYKIHWKGYDEETWQDARIVEECEALDQWGEYKQDCDVEYPRTWNQKTYQVDESDEGPGEGDGDGDDDDGNSDAAMPDEVLMGNDVEPDAEQSEGDVEAEQPEGDGEPEAEVTDVEDADPDVPDHESEAKDDEPAGDGAEDRGPCVPCEESWHGEHDGPAGEPIYDGTQKQNADASNSRYEGDDHNNDDEIPNIPSIRIRPAIFDDSDEDEDELISEDNAEMEGHGQAFITSSPRLRGEFKTVPDKRARNCIDPPGSATSANQYPSPALPVLTRLGGVRSSGEKKRRIVIFYESDDEMEVAEVAKMRKIASGRMSSGLLRRME